MLLVRDIVEEKLYNETSETKSNRIYLNIPECR